MAPARIGGRIERYQCGRYPSSASTHTGQFYRRERDSVRSGQRISGRPDDFIVCRQTLVDVKDMTARNVSPSFRLPMARSGPAGLKPLLMNALEKVRAKLIDISSTYGHEGAKGAISFDAMRNAPLLQRQPRHERRENAAPML